MAKRLKGNSSDLALRRWKLDWQHLDRPLPTGTFKT
jgi:hypothetical protein